MSGAAAARAPLGSWARLDDGFPEHPKVLRAEAQTAGAAYRQVTLICWASQYLTDGHVPEARAEAGASEAAPKQVAALLATGLLERCRRHEGCLVIHDYLNYQRSRAEVEADREVKAAAGRIGGRRSAASRRARYGSAQPPSGAEAPASVAASAGASVGPEANSEAPVPVDSSLSVSLSPSEAAPSSPGEASVLRLEPDIEPSSLAETINQIEAEFQAGHAEWRAETGRARAKPRRFTAKDRRNVAALLRDRYAPFTPDELCRVAHGWRFSSWHRGDDPRTGGHRYHDAGLIFRDAEKARMFLGFFDEAHERRGAESIDSVAEVGGEVITAEVIQSWEARVRRGEAPAYDASEAEVWAYERAKANVEAAAMRPTAVAL